MKVYSVEGVPGTGKTTLCSKVFAHYAKKGSACYETFRRNMADDFIHRVSDNFDEEEFARVFRWVSTTHGICYRLLLSELDLEVATWKDFKRFCKVKGIQVDTQELKRLRPDSEDPLTHITELETLGGKIYTIYQNCVNMNIDYYEWDKLPPRMKPFIPPNWHEKVAQIIHEWEDYLERKHLVDFPQMLKKAYEMKLAPYTEVYIADEFQDKTPIQFELFKIWSKASDVVLVAFDKNQAIYSFWGTSPQFCDLVRKKSKFKILTPSYRLSRNVYKTACKLLQISGQEVFNVECVGDTILKFVDLTYIPLIINSHRNVMIIARTNYILYQIAKMLMHEGIPFTGRYGWGSEQLQLYKFVWKYKNKKPVSKGELITFLKKAEYLQPSINFLLKTLKSELTYDEVNSILDHGLKLILSKENPFEHLDLTEKGKWKLYRALRNSTPPRDDIFLTTIHGAKGLEADTIIVVDGITPKIAESITIDREDWKNEHRVWYVALTRARKYCYVVTNANFKSVQPFVSGLKLRGE